MTDLPAPIGITSERTVDVPRSVYLLQATYYCFLTDMLCCQFGFMVLAGCIVLFSSIKLHFFLMYSSAAIFGWIAGVLKPYAGGIYHADTDTVTCTRTDVSKWNDTNLRIAGGAFGWIAILVGAVFYSISENAWWPFALAFGTVLFWSIYGWYTFRRREQIWSRTLSEGIPTTAGLQIDLHLRGKGDPKLVKVREKIRSAKTIESRGRY